MDPLDYIVPLLATGITATALLTALFVYDLRQAKAQRARRRYRATPPTIRERCKTPKPRAPDDF